MGVWVSVVGGACYDSSIMKWHHKYLILNRGVSIVTAIKDAFHVRKW